MLLHFHNIKTLAVYISIKFCDSALLNISQTRAFEENEPMLFWWKLVTNHCDMIQYEMLF